MLHFNDTWILDVFKTVVVTCSTDARAVLFKIVLNILYVFIVKLSAR
jgi:hypothetical protein